MISINKDGLILCLREDLQTIDGKLLTKDEVVNNYLDNTKFVFVKDEQVLYCYDEAKGLI